MRERRSTSAALQRASIIALRRPERKRVLQKVRAARSFVCLFGVGGEAREWNACLQFDKIAVKCCCSYAAGFCWRTVARVADKVRRR